MGVVQDQCKKKKKIGLLALSFLHHINTKLFVTVSFKTVENIRYLFHSTICFKIGFHKKRNLNYIP